MTGPIHSTSRYVYFYFYASGIEEEDKIMFCSYLSIEQDKQFNFNCYCVVFKAYFHCFRPCVHHYDIMLLYIGVEVKPLDHQGKYFHDDIYIN